MNNILAIIPPTPNEVEDEIAAKVKARRLELNLTQEGMAIRSGLKFSTYRRFEQTGEIRVRGRLSFPHETISVA